MTAPATLITAAQQSGHLVVVPVGAPDPRYVRVKVECPRCGNVLQAREDTLPGLPMHRTSRTGGVCR